MSGITPERLAVLSEAQAELDRWVADGWKATREGWAWPEWRKPGRFPELMSRACVVALWPDLADAEPPVDLSRPTDVLAERGPEDGGAPA